MPGNNIVFKGKTGASTKQRSRKKSRQKDDPILIRSRKAFLRAIDELRAAQILGIDLENDNFYRYRERLCLLQISTEEKIFLFDCLSKELKDLGPLREIFENPACTKILHDGHQDIQLLKKHSNLPLVNIFDTQVAARFLGIMRYGLKKLVYEYLNVTISKEETQADWSRRPLGDRMIEYAANDVRYLIALYRLLTDGLAQAGRSADAEEYFSYLETVEPEIRVFNPDSFYRIPGARELPSEQLPLLKALNTWREERARQRNRPYFMILNDSTLMRIVQEAPRSEAEWNQILGHLGKYKEQLKQVIEKAQNADPIDVEAITIQKRYVLPHQLEEAAPEDLGYSFRYRALSQWRRDKAMEEELDADLILPKPIMQAISQENPASVADLKTRPGFSEYRKEKYGPEIVELLKDCPRSYTCYLCKKELLETTIVAQCPFCRVKYHLQEILAHITTTPSCPNCAQEISLT